MGKDVPVDINGVEKETKMVRATATAVLMLLALGAQAQNVKWSVDANTTSCDTVLNTGAVVNVLSSGGFCIQPVSAATVGANTAKCTAKGTDPIWGALPPSSQVSFAFTRPGQVGAPTSPVLTP